MYKQSYKVNLDGTRQRVLWKKEGNLYRYIATKEAKDTGSKIWAGDVVGFETGTRRASYVESLNARPISDYLYHKLEGAIHNQRKIDITPQPTQA